MKRALSLFLFLCIAIPITSNELDWHRIGPSAGSVRQLVPDRGNPGIWYLVENQFSRLYRSTDDGETWKFTGFNGIRNLLVHPANSELFVVVSGRDFKESLLSSKDFGRTFQLRSGNSPSKIFAHPTDPNILWGEGVQNDFYNLSLSLDGGAHWKGFNNLPYRYGKEYDIDGWKLSPDSYSLSSVLVSPLDSKTVYVSTAVEFDLGCSGVSIDLELVSTNLGKTWASAKIPSGQYIYDPAFPERAFSVNYEGVRTLTSRGWKTLSTKRLEDVVNVPGKPEQLFGYYYGTQWLSRDGGVNWRSIDIGPTGKARVVQARTSPEGSLLAGTDGGGVYVIDGNLNWLPAPGLHEARIHGVASAPGSNIVYAIAGFRDAFLYRSMDSGKSWLNMSDKFLAFRRDYPYPDLIVNQKNARHVFLKTENKVLVSFNAGDTWSALSEYRISRVFFAPNYETVYFSRPEYNHLYISNDGGRTIRELQPEFGIPRNTIYDIAIDAFNGYVYVATEHGLFLQKGTGQKPEQIATELSPDCLQCMRFDQILALPLRGQYIVTSNGDLYKSVNQGVTWRKIDHAPGTIFIGDNKGLHLYRLIGPLVESRDGGATWTNISGSIHTRLLNRTYDDGVFAMTDPRFRPIYAGTSLGLFKSN